MVADRMIRSLATTEEHEGTHPPGIPVPQSMALTSIHRWMKIVSLDRGLLWSLLVGFGLQSDCPKSSASPPRDALVWVLV